MDETAARVTAVLREQFGIAAVSVTRQTGGWSALAFRVETATARYFLKVYDKQRNSTARLIAPTGFYLPVTKWLHDHASLSGKIVNPILTTDGRYTYEDDGYYYLLFEYIPGSTVGDNKLSAGQMAELGEIVGRLHSATSGVPLPDGAVYEDYTLPFDGLAGYIDNELGSAPADIRSILQPESVAISKMIDRVRRLAETARAGTPPFVLCHTDIHNWNLMVNENLVLVDLENLKLAPPEHDLYMILPGPHAAEFMGVYRRFMPDYPISGSLIEFYTIRRELEDIWEWIKQLVHDRPNAETRASALHWLGRNVGYIVRLAATR